MPSQPLVDFRGELLNPATDSGMINGHAALTHHLLQITVVDPIAAVPAHRPENDLAVVQTTDGASDRQTAASGWFAI